MASTSIATRPGTGRTSTARAASSTRPRAWSEPESRALDAFVKLLHPAITIWYHQHANLVDASIGGDVAIERDYARRVGLRLVPSALPRFVHRLAEHNLPGTTAFVVELPAGPCRPRPSSATSPPWWRSRVEASDPGLRCRRRRPARCWACVAAEPCRPRSGGRRVGPCPRGLLSRSRHVLRALPRGVERPRPGRHGRPHHRGHRVGGPRPAGSRSRGRRGAGVHARSWVAFPDLRSTRPTPRTAPRRATRSPGGGGCAAR